MKKGTQTHNNYSSTIKSIDAEAILISDSYNMRYLSGFTGGCGHLYLSENKKIILTDSRYTIQAQDEADEYKVIEVSGTDGYVNAINALLLEEKVKVLAFESKKTSYADYLDWKEKLNVKTLLPMKDEFTSLRQVKHDFELERLKMAESIGDKAFSKILSVIKPGMTELEVAAHLEFYLKEAGAEGLSFDTIVASGANSAMPHAVPTKKRLETGDFVTMDFGCIYGGYCSDMTRTVVMGKASSRQKKVYQTVLDAQEAALSKIKEGMEGAEVDKIARDVISKAGYGNHFGHGLGHGVGLYIHEEPRLSPTDRTVLKAGMVETVEPGVYIKGFGGVRIEDMVCVTKKGCMNFTKSDKNLIEL